MSKKKIVIIGGGVSGMATGIYAQMNGFDSQIIEKHSISGGICTAWYRKKYRFDYSVQWMVGTREGAFHDALCETGIIDDSVEIHSSDVHNRCVAQDGSDLIIYTDLERWKNYLIEMAPEDEKVIKKLCHDINWASTLCPFDIAPELRGIFDYIKSGMKCYKSIYMALTRGRKTYLEYIQGLGFKNEKLKEKLLNIYGEGNFSAYAFLLIMGWYQKKNSAYPMGGSLGVAERMQAKYERLGGSFLFKKEVEEIMVENDTAKGVRLTDGTIIEADYVISAADGYLTLFNLLKGKYLSNELKNAYNSWELFPSFVQVSFGINKKLENDYHVEVHLAKDKKIGSTTLAHNYRILNYNYDESMAPEGKSCITMRFDSPYEIWQNLSEEEYKAEKQAIERDALAILEKHYPGSSAFVEASDVATPKTTIRYTNVWKGAYEGFIPTPKNIIKQLNQRVPGLNNFFLAGQWLFPGGGIPPSVNSGKWAIQLICKDEKKKFVVV